VFAQDSNDAPPPHLAVVDGTATLDREDVTEPATVGAPLVPGDRVRTERGRAELLFPDGSAVDLDEYSTIELEGPTLLRMTSGRVLLFAAGANNPASAVQFQIDTPVASAQTDGPGEYRVSILGSPSALQTEMAVIRGGGALVTELGTMPLRSGERSTAWDNAAPSRPQIFNSARYDAFDQWSMGLRDERLGSRSQSAQYLPADLRMYGGELDRNGSWNYEAPYGYVWYPSVAPEWRPYYDGYWSSVPTYGWTWIGVDVWSWPTHHYGRWGYARSRWFWIPDRRWSPAWVSWGGAAGYVSWCPLGFDNRPVFALSASVGGGYRGWTVLSRDHFGGHRSVRQFAVSPRSLPATVGFVAQASAPVPPPRAVARRGVGNGGQLAGDRRQFPNVVGRSGDGAHNAALPRRADNGDRRAAGQVTQPGRPSVTRSPQGVGRQPQTNGQIQPNGQPRRSEPGGAGDRQRAVSRQPQGPSVHAPEIPSAQTPQNGDRPSNDGQKRGAVSPRPSAPRAPVQPIAPAVPQRSEQRQSGNATRRAEPIRPNQPAAPESPQPGVARRSGGPIYTQRPTAPPPMPAPQQEPQRRERQQPSQREERSSPPRQEPPHDEGQARGHENRQSSSDRKQDQKESGGDGHHRK
jgi:hypothetical protein